MLAQILQTVRDIAATLTDQFGPRRGRSLGVTGAACVGTTLVGLGKLAMGVASLSFFTCVSALYSFGMVFAKVCALAGLLRAEDRPSQLRYCRLSGAVLTAASLLYMIYSAQLLWRGADRGYPLVIALGIATFTFAELALNLRGVLAERRGDMPPFYAIRTINLASALISLVLTQRALLSLSAEGDLAVRARANALFGVLMSLVATLLGVGLILRMNRANRDPQD